MQNGKERIFDYDKLILAQGGNLLSRHFQESIKNVFTLWTLSDMDKINTFITNKNQKLLLLLEQVLLGLRW